MGIEIPKADWTACKDAAGGCQLNIWATTPNPRNESKSLGIRCQVPEVGNSKPLIQNFHGDESRLDEVTLLDIASGKKGYRQKREKKVYNDQIFNPFEDQSKAEWDEFAALDEIYSCDQS